MGFRRRSWKHLVGGKGEEESFERGRAESTRNRGRTEEGQAAKGHEARATSLLCGFSTRISARSEISLAAQRKTFCSRTMPRIRDIRAICSDSSNSRAW